VGSVARSGGTDDPDTVVEALTDALVGDREPVDEPLPEPSRD
jgi:hypothetical protein